MPGATPSKDTLFRFAKATPEVLVSIHVPAIFPVVTNSLKFKVASFPLLLLLQILSEVMMVAVSGSLTSTKTSVNSSGQLVAVTVYLKIKAPAFCPVPSNVFPENPVEGLGVISVQVPPGSASVSKLFKFTMFPFSLQTASGIAAVPELGGIANIRSMVTIESQPVLKLIMVSVPVGFPWL